MSKPIKKGNRLNDLRAIHDRNVVIPNRIRAAIATLLASGDEWIYELDFLKLSKPPIGSVDISKFRDGFVDYWAEMPSVNGKATMRRVWFATTKACLDWKENIGG
jgi:hypothetical protein